MSFRLLHNNLTSVNTLKRQTKNAADDTDFCFHFYLLKKIRLGVSCESSA